MFDLTEISNRIVTVGISIIVTERKASTPESRHNSNSWLEFQSPVGFKQLENFSLLHCFISMLSMRYL